MLISIIIPVKNEERALPSTLEKLLLQRGEFETIVVDGGSSDRSIALAKQWEEPFRKTGRKLKKIQSFPGRGLQMNRGAREAEGEILLFLHADTWLPDGALEKVREKMADPNLLGGGFAHRFREKGYLLRCISFYSTWRGAIRRSFCGDQALFVRRSVFLRMGGFREMPLLEDLEFTRRLRRHGRVGFIFLPVRTSARRVRKVGVFRFLVFIALAKIFFAVDRIPEFLTRKYPEVR